MLQTRSLTSSDTVLVVPTPCDTSEARALETVEEFGDSDSQISYKDSMSSLIDFDPDETMASQQTAATDVTQPSPLRVRQVSKKARSQVDIRPAARLTS